MNLLPAKGQTSVGAGATTIDLSKSIVKSGGEYVYNASGIASQLPSGTGDFAGALLDLASNWNNLSKLTPSQKTALSVHLISTGVALVPVVGWIISGLLEGEYVLANALLGDQGSKCGTDQSKPYGGYDASTFSYGSMLGTFDPAPTGSFAEFAQQMLVADFNANSNCWQDARLRMPVVLSLAVQAWNASHSSAGTAKTQGSGGIQIPVPNSGGTMTFRYAVNNPYGNGQSLLQQVNPNFGWPQSSDPIAVTLNTIAGVGHTNQQGFGGTPMDASPVPQPAYVTFTVHNGPAVSTATAKDSLNAGWHPAAKVALGVAATAAVAAGGVGIWALLTQQAYGEAWSRVLGHVVGEARASGALLIEADPLKGAKLLGAGEPKKRSMKVQSLLFPVDTFTVAQAKAWAKNNHFKSAKVDTTERYHRLRQFSPAKSTVLRTISLGDSGVRAVVAR